MAVAMKPGCPMSEPLNDGQRFDRAPQAVARTPLGERLLQIREWIIASGETLLSWEEIEREVAGR
jgi:hypothetical protein